ncbi:MAG TPA: cytochrome c oxidase subunit 3 [Caulobacteraceae bacterium]|jgi:cytochrome c oxidase subunit 3|nr:cytochrome c oxidase subunit 3 [Caulobacteraceae bacterium]
MSRAALLHEPFTNIPREQEAFLFGLWSFLASEALFFGALFLGYAVVRHLHIAGFDIGARHTNAVFGTLNTAILLTSSLTMAIAERGALADRTRLARIMLALTLMLGAAFLVVKGFEYHEDLEEHLLPGHGFAIPLRGAVLFFSFYWVMTGVHALHLSIGLGLVGRLFGLSLAGRLVENRASIQTTTLYWHLVDLIWVFLFPLFYLVARG